MTSSKEKMEFPESEFFSQEELKQFYDQLVAEKTTILEKAKAAIEAGTMHLDSNEMMDEVDQATAMIDQNLTLRLLDRDRKLMGEIDRAIAKIKSGDYGYCEGTGDEIPKKRLELRPWTRHSVKYKEQIERGRAAGRGLSDEDPVEG